MSNNQELKDIILAALNEASTIISIKDSILDSILEVSEMLKETTNGKVLFNVTNATMPNFTTNNFIFIKRQGDVIGLYDSILCGYKIDEDKGFPVNIEDEYSILTCKDNNELKKTLVEMIASPSISMKIIKLINMDLGNSELPF